MSMQEKIEAAKQRIEAASPVTFRQITKGENANKNARNDDGHFNFQVKAGGQQGEIKGFYSAMTQNSKSEAPFAQYTKAEWNAAFNPLWAQNRYIEFVVCEDGSVFFYVWIRVY